MNTTLDTARAFAHQFLNYEKSKGTAEIPDEKIREIIDKVAAIDIVAELDKAELFDILAADLSQGRGKMSEISDKLKPWLSDEKANIDFKLWSRYKLYMMKKDPSFPINDLDDFTNTILDKCVNPKQAGSWDRRGMVVGHVQSGKTSNYVGLINKAADAGYKLIIVIAGTMNSLRRQTQQRVDEGFTGVNSSTGAPTGVGEIKTEIQIYPLTSSSIIPDGDFDQRTATKKGFPIGKNPVVLVIKKNKSILENLIDWLSSNEKTEEINGEFKLMGVPTLIIDDEADSASVNTVSRKKISKAEALEEAKTINRLIRTLLNLFEKNTFVGYTATPYANLFIPQEWSKEMTATVKKKQYKVGSDLFPKDFILNIKAPKNYLGASAIFGYENPVTGISKEPLSIIRRVEIQETPFVFLDGFDDNLQPVLKNAKRADPLPDELPDSMKEAILAFILTCAIRRIRGQAKKHNSMLVHVMLYVNWIDRVARLVNEQLAVYVSYIEGKDSEFLAGLKTFYEEDFVPTTIDVRENLNYTDLRIKDHSWKEVFTELKNAASKIEVRSVHGTASAANLEYKNIREIDYEEFEEKGLSVIAVGGSRLARGITLEGLSVSYYLRASKMYDTLMQMGRWFGYRPGYADLMRLYTTDTLTEWFNHIAMATENMRNDFDILASLPGVTPARYQLKVQNHPGLLTITAATKLFWAQNIDVSFSGQNPQTYQLLKDEKSIQRNFKAFSRFFETLGPPQNENLVTLRNGSVSHLLYRNADIEAICDFLDLYTIEQPSIKNATLSAYIRAQDRKRNIKGWNVVIRSNSDTEVFINTTGKKAENKIPNKEALRYYFHEGPEKISIGAVVRNQPVESPKNHYYISKNQIDDLNDRRVDLKNVIADLKDNEHIKQARAIAGYGLLLIYLLDPRGAQISDLTCPIVGYSIHFPMIENEQTVSYMATPEPDMDETQDDDDLKEGEA